MTHSSDPPIGPLPYASAALPYATARQRAVRDYLRGGILLALTGLLMRLSFPSYGLWFLTPVCLAPFGICALRRPAGWRWLALYYALGAIWFFFSLHWLWPITIGGSVALCAFIGLYWALFALAFRRLVVHLRWPALVALPVTWVCTEYLRTTVFGGFPWFPIGNALAGPPIIIQTADLGGVWLLSFLAASTSGILVDIYRLPLRQSASKRWNPRLCRLVLIWVLVHVAALGYGFFRLHQAPGPAGPRVAVVQEYVPQEQKDTSDDAAKRAWFDKHLAWSYQAAPEHPDLIAWPETMVPEPINTEILTLVGRTPAAQTYLDNCRSFDRDLRMLAAKSGAFLIVGTPYRALGDDDQMVKQNAAVLYQPGRPGPTSRVDTNPTLTFPRSEGSTLAGQVPPHYAKRILVPFGEYVPFAGWPWLHHLLLALTPFPDYDYSLTPGDSWHRFAIALGGGYASDPSARRVVRFGTPICYEDVMPEACRQFVLPTSDCDSENANPEAATTRKKVEFLVSMSNDGWFRSADELDQHLQMDQIRAVENRVPIARSVNGGGSGFVDSDGRILKTLPHFVGGYAVATLTLDDRVSLFSLTGDWFAILCGIVTALGVAWTLVRPRLGAKMPPIAPEMTDVTEDRPAEEPNTSTE
jgi:apolipoprotein N-acyltransferase